MTLPRGRFVSVKGNPTTKNATIDGGLNTLPPNAATDASLVTINSSVSGLAVASTTLTHTTLTCSGSTQVALASNPSAKYRLFINSDATNKISISFSVAAVAGTQILLQPLGSISFNKQMGNLDTRAVNAIASAGSPVLLITEGT